MRSRYDGSFLSVTPNHVFKRAAGRRHSISWRFVAQRPLDGTLSIRIRTSPHFASTALSSDRYDCDLAPIPVRLAV